MNTSFGTADFLILLTDEYLLWNSRFPDLLTDEYLLWNSRFPDLLTENTFLVTTEFMAAVYSRMNTFLGKANFLIY
jgi:hypothetical protein